MKLLRRTWHVVSILALLVIVGALFALDMRLHELQPALVAAQKQRYLAQQQREAETRQNQPPPIATSGQPPADSDEERRADRKEQIAIERETLKWASIAARTGIASVVITALILAFQTLFTSQAARAALNTAKAALLAERAYVTLSHHPPGIGIDDLEVDDSRHDGPVFYAGISVGVQNFGNTPARVTYAVINACFHRRPLPATPPYDEAEGQALGGLVVRGDAFNIDKLFRLPVAETRVAKSLASALEDHPLKLIVIGYVDYIDQFGTRRRAGYGRMYNPLQDSRTQFTNATGIVDEHAYKRRNNLPFITEPGYNYDRERTKGEGVDWNDPEHS